ncbi:MAG: redoxin domain-containing protein [Nocardioidaceae bacterium]
MTHDPTQLPRHLPRPDDDGAARHLTGERMPKVKLPSTAGGLVPVDAVQEGFDRLVVYAYPLTGRPGVAVPDGWDEIPGARGCTPESCGFRDHAADLAAAGAAVVGVSTQSTGYQSEAVERLRLPFPLLSDRELRLAGALSLPTMRVDIRNADGGGTQTLLKRLTLVVCGGEIEHVFYPVFPPDGHSEEVLAWVRR